MTNITKIKAWNENNQKSSPNLSQKRKADVMNFINEVRTDLVKAFLPEVQEASNILLAVAWTSIYIASMAMFFIQFKPLVEKYLNNDVAVDIKVVSVKNLNFPQITVCNENMLKKSILQQIQTNNLNELALLDEVEELYTKFTVSQALQYNEDDVDDFRCPDSYYRCTAKFQCVPKIWVCDGYPDCQDSTDEGDADSALCQQYSKYKPDSDKICVNSSQEVCESNAMICATKCDGVVQCPGAEDEVGCEHVYSYTALYYKQTVESHFSYGYSNYSANYSKEIKFYTNSDSSHLELKFISIDIENSTGCTADFVKVTFYNGSSVKLCGNIGNLTYVQLAPVTILFKTNEKIQRRGFKIEYKTVHFEYRKKRSASTTASKNYDISSLGSSEPTINALINSLNVTQNDWKGIYYCLRQSQPPCYSLISELIKFPPDIPYSYGFQLKDFVVQCEYMSSDCLNDFEALMNEHYGNCYIFNSPKGTLRQANQSGSSYALRFLLFLDSSENIGLLNPTQGAALTINHRSVIPQPNKNSILIQPGSVTRISIKEKRLQRKEGVYSNCVNTTDSTAAYSLLKKFSKHVMLEKDYIELIEKGLSQLDTPSTLWKRYNKDVCIEFCIYETLLGTCGCVDSYLIIYHNKYGIPQAPFPICNAWNVTQTNCKNDIYEKFSDDKIPCNCEVSCFDVDYDIKISTTKWPHESFYPYLIDELAQTSSTSLKNFLINLVSTEKGGGYVNDVGELISNNFAKVEVFFEDINYELIKQRPSYTIEELLAAFAGNLGMWVGWSILTFAHTALLILKLLYRSIRSLKTLHGKNSP